MTSQDALPTISTEVETLTLLLSLLMFAAAAGKRREASSRIEALQTIPASFRSKLVGDDRTH